MAMQPPPQRFGVPASQAPPEPPRGEDQYGRIVFIKGESKNGQPPNPVEGSFLVPNVDGFTVYDEEQLEFNAPRPWPDHPTTWPVPPGSPEHQGTRIRRQWLAPFAMRLRDGSYKVVPLKVNKTLREHLHNMSQFYDLRTTQVSMTKAGKGTDTKPVILPLTPPDPTLNVQALIDSIPERPGAPFDKISEWLNDELMAEAERCQAIIARGPQAAQAPLGGSGVAQPASPVQSGFPTQGTFQPAPAFQNGQPQKVQIPQPPGSAERWTEQGLMALGKAALRAEAGRWHVAVPADDDGLVLRRREIITQIMKMQATDDVFTQGV